MAAGHDNFAAAGEIPRRLFYYNAGFLRDQRLRRILTLAGHELRLGLPRRGEDAAGNGLSGKGIAGDGVAVWGRSPYARRGEAVAARRAVPLVRIEDAFLRSIRPGRMGDPPMGLMLDPLGVHFDSASPSALERILAQDPLDDHALLVRARDGMARMRALDLSKYNMHDADLPLPAPGYVLVIDQTRGDASIRHGGASAATFAEMLVAALSEHPGARVVIKTHPETAQGLRPGHFDAKAAAMPHMAPSASTELVPGGAPDLPYDPAPALPWALSPPDLSADIPADPTAALHLALADPRVSLLSAPVSPRGLLEGAIAVYAVTSQLGFEAVLAGHRPQIFGQPWYAGWGLTEDRMPLARRKRKLTRAQLFAAAMIRAPLWYDPCRDRLCSFEEALNQIEAELRAFREDRHGHVACGMRLWKRQRLAAVFGSGRGLVFETDPARAATRARTEGRDLLIWAGKEPPELAGLLAGGTTSAALTPADPFTSAAPAASPLGDSPIIASTMEPRWGSAAASAVVSASAPSGKPASQPAAPDQAASQTGTHTAQGGAAAQTPVRIPILRRVEDGFLRSRGLGAELVPPLSLVADDCGIYYDPGRESRLERLILAPLPAGGEDRATRLIAMLTAGGISKYNLGGALPELPLWRASSAGEDGKGGRSALEAGSAAATGLAFGEHAAVLPSLVQALPNSSRDALPPTASEHAAGLTPSVAEAASPPSVCELHLGKGDEGPAPEDIPGDAPKDAFIGAPDDLGRGLPDDASADARGGERWDGAVTDPSPGHAAAPDADPIITSLRRPVPFLRAASSTTASSAGMPVSPSSATAPLPSADPASTPALSPLRARRILVPGQVEDDASIRLGTGTVCTNLALLRVARAANPAAVLIYKPHPDVEAGLRPGALAEADLAGLADVVAAHADPIALIAAVDEVWTMTSALGFEALLRGRTVTCLGAPFYAGWGLTRDLGPVPARRSRAADGHPLPRPGLAHLAHAALIAYPRYYDPQSRRPCPPEVAVERLAQGAIPKPGPALRLLAKLQGLFASQARLWR